MRAISFSTVLIYTTGLGIYASGFGRFDPADHGAIGFRKKHYFSASECQDNRRNLSCRFVNPGFSAYFHAFCGSFQCRYRRHCSDACSADLRMLAVIDRKASFDHSGRNLFCSCGFRCFLNRDQRKFHFLGFLVWRCALGAGLGSFFCGLFDSAEKTHH